MVWVYEVFCRGPVSAARIRDDFDAIAGGNPRIDTDQGGVSTLGRWGIVVTNKRAPKYEEMTQQDYVLDITETRELPDRADPDFSVPVQLRQGITLIE